MKSRFSSAVVGHALALSLCACAALAVAADPKAAKYYEDALVRYEKKDLKGAIIQLKNALSIDKKQLPVHMLLGRALLENGEIAAASVALEEALRQGANRAEVVLPLARSMLGQAKPQAVLDDPQFVLTGLSQGTQFQLLLIKAQAAGSVGDQRSALKFIEAARALEPSNADTWIAEIPLRLLARQVAEATVAADKALSLTPSSAEALYQRGTIAHLIGDTRTALGFYNRTLAGNATHTEALVSRAGLLMDLGRSKDAAVDIAELRKSSAIDPRGAYLAALLAEREGKEAEVRAALQQVTALLDPVPIEFLRYRSQLLMLGGLSHYGLNQREKARGYLEAALRNQPNSPAAKLLAEIQLAQGNTDRAVETLSAYLKAHPNDVQAAHLLASVHISQGRSARAASLMQDAVKKSDLPQLQALLGQSLVRQGKVGDAVKALEAAVKRDPGQSQASAALVSIYMQSGQAAKAVKVAEALVKSQPNLAGAHNMLGSARAAGGDMAGAKAAYLRALELAPSLTSARINLARLDAMAGASDAAISQLNAVVAKEAKSVEALSELGRILARLGKTADAQRLYERADDHAGPNNFEPALALVNLHLEAGDPAKAAEATKRLTTRAPEAIPVILAVARVSLAKGDAAAARSGLSRAASQANYNAPLLIQIARLQISANHLADAGYSLEKALNERPDLVEAQALLAEVEMRSGDFAKSEQRARQLIAKHPKLGIGHTLLANLALTRGERGAAIDAYRRAHQIDGSTDSLLRLFNVLSQADPAAANQLAEQWLKAKPRDLAVQRALADGYGRAGRFKEAKAAYEAVLPAMPKDADLLNNLAHTLIELKDPGALPIAERAMAARPQAAHIIGTVGWAAFKAGQTDRGLQLLRDARLRNPGNPDTRYYLGAVLASVGRKAEARDELEAALKVSKSFASAKQAEALLGTLR